VCKDQQRRGARTRPERLLRSLAEHEVEFCVIGAVAAWLQGNPSVTLDLDVMPRRELDNAERLAAALNALVPRGRAALTPRSNSRLSLSRAPVSGAPSGRDLVSDG
jgi:hypothetical protein